MDTSLKDWGGIFDSATHTYTLNGKVLHGITKMLHRQIFKDMYKDVPQYILDKSAERGTNIHNLCHLHDMGIEIPSDSEYFNEVTEYANITNGLTYEDSEYIVTDGEYFASGIDKVYRVDDNTFDIGDIKTTYAKNEDYVTWQLNIYKYLFELQNPSMKVRNMYYIYIREGKSELIKVRELSQEWIKSLLDAEKNGKEYELPSELVRRSELPSNVANVENAIISTILELKSLEERKKQFEQTLLELMEKGNVKKWETENIAITRVLPTNRKSIDSAKLKELYPDVYNDCIKESTTKSSVKITIK